MEVSASNSIHFNSTTTFSQNAKLGQVKSEQVNLGQVKSGQVKFGQVKLGQVKLRQVKAGEVISQDRSN